MICAYIYIYIYTYVYIGVVKEAVGQDGKALRYAAEKLQGDRVVVMEALCVISYMSINNF